MAGAFPIGIPKEKDVIFQICCKFLTLSKRIDIIDQCWIWKCFWQMTGSISWRIPHEKWAFSISGLIPAMYNGLSFCDNLWIFDAFCLKSAPRLIYLKKREKILSKPKHFPLFTVLMIGLLKYFLNLHTYSLFGHFWSKSLILSILKKSYYIPVNAELNMLSYCFNLLGRSENITNITLIAQNNVYVY